MKLFKKLSTLLAAAAMMLMTVTTTNAAETKPSIKMDKEGANFSAYRVLDATEEASGTFVYSVNDNFKSFFENTKYGSYTFNPDKGISNGKKVIVSADGDVIDKAGGSNRGDIHSESEVNKLTTQLQKFITDNKATLTESYKLDGSAKEATDVTAGYYLILEDGDSKVVDNKIISTSRSMIVDVTTYVKISPKDSEFTVGKKIVEGEAQYDENSAHYGDTVSYEIQAALPKADPNETPKYTITDTLDGLYFDESNVNLVVKSVSTNEEYKIGTDYTVAFKENSEITTKGQKTRVMTINFNYDSPTVRANSNTGDGIKITYDAIVADDAHLNKNTGNPNTVKIEFGNATIESKTTTYVYKFDILKYGVKGSDDTKKVLGGVTFELKDNAYPNDDTKKYTATTDNKGNLSFEGLKAGTYTLKETSTVNGYALLKEPITVHVDDSNTDGIPEITIDGVSTDYAEVKDGSIVISIYNYEGISLPETGGMGTTMFMIGGAALVVLAGALLIVYSKKSKKA